MEYGLQGERFYGQFIAAPAALILLIIILPPLKEAIIEMGQMGRRSSRSESTARPIQENRLIQATKNRERETETRLDPTPMAHTQHNRKDSEHANLETIPFSDATFPLPSDRMAFSDQK